MKTAVLLAFTLALSGCVASTNAPETVYGRPRALTTAPLTLTEAASESNVGQTLAVKAPAAEVCQNKGCWMVLTEGPRSIRVTFVSPQMCAMSVAFEDHGDIVPGRGATTCTRPVTLSAARLGP